MTTTRAPRMTIVLMAASLAAGCVEYDRAIVFDNDGSGRASLRMAMDIEALLGPMVEAMAKGRGGAAAGPAQLAAMKQKLLDSLRASFAAEGPTIDITPVPGATVIDKSVTLDGHKLLIAAAVGFSDPSVIRRLRFSLTTDAGTSQVPNLEMFEDLDVTADAGSVVVTTKNVAAVRPPAAALPPAEALKGLEALLGTDSPLQGVLTKAVSGMRLATRIEAPWAIVETNAPVRNGNTVAWEFTGDSLAPLSAAAAQNMLVRYKR